ncbi:MAG: UDP-N-acetylmuramate--L-alanine ligase [Candidatus Gracilibacteria bacterium]|nr:UDP-N-acetylmuramate--L-alanine ligase [Candidatus Gracilibacteria bacterium]MDD2908866.1 UDP-N-acetylmuramate--L-alanine ligase [Candidatus Gracilibacteria bacterium]
MRTETSILGVDNIHFIGIGGIGISAVARYYNNLGYSISGSSDSNSPLIEQLKNEGMNIIIGDDEKNIPSNTNLVIYTEAIFRKDDFDNLVTTNTEYHKAEQDNIRILSYPESLAEIVNSKKCIAVAGSHGKSTTTSLLGIILQDSTIGGSTIVGTQVPQFGNSNFHYEDSPYFAIEACEYRRSFLQYRPYISIITNIDLDHLDYFKDLPDYISAFESLQNQTNGFMILNGNCPNSQKLIETGLTTARPVSDGKPKQIWVYDKYFLNEIGEKVFFKDFELQIPGEHIAFDAKLAYTCAKILGLTDDYIISKLESYKGVWRRNEIIKTTENGNILISDYGHHPTEIKLTLDAIKGKYSDKKLLVVFQPHQYSRTIELITGFKNCFTSADTLIIPNIYFSRDTGEDVAKMPAEKFVKILQENNPQTIYGNGLDNTLEFIKKYDEKNPNSSIIILLGAGNVDDLRDGI